ncbi:MAG: hypothetical protein HY820_45775, partial [Acidobacteria bacterium]|nr:hypothetical protein [Acidobacteriota bacterium]
MGFYPFRPAAIAGLLLVSVLAAPVDAAISIVQGSPQSAAVGAAYSVRFKALTDVGGEFPEGIPVVFTAPATGPSGTFPGGVRQVVVFTDSSAVATAPLFTANTVAGQYVMTVWDGFGQASIHLTNLPGPPADIQKLEGDNQFTTVAQNFPYLHKAYVRDSFGNLIQGVQVRFTNPPTGPGGRFSGSYAATVFTDTFGRAIAPVLTANTVAGGFGLSACVEPTPLCTTFIATNLPGPAASITPHAGSPQSAVVNTPFAIALQAAVRDQYGNPRSGATVAFNAPTSGASGSFPGGSAATAVSDSQGIATAPAFAANGVAGGYAVNATTAGVGTPAAFLLTNAPNMLSVTVTSNPLGRTVRVDGTSRTTPASFTWEAGSQHTIEAADQPGDTNTRY